MSITPPFIRTFALALSLAICLALLSAAAVTQAKTHTTCTVSHPKRGSHACKPHTRHVAKKPKATKKTHAPPAMVAALCEDGSAPLASGGSYSCADGSAPTCAGGSTTVPGASGAAPLCPASGQGNPSPAGASCETEGGCTFAGEVASEEGATSCEACEAPALREPED